MANHLPRHYDIPALNGLRAICASLVIFSHVITPSTKIHVISTHCSVGVDVFFVLSGFLITWILLDEMAATTTINIPRFYTRRALRLQPAYFSAVGLNLLAYYFFERTAFVGLRKALPYYLTYSMNEAVALSLFTLPIFAVAWSLCIEEQFYFTWSFVMRGLGDNCRRLLNICFCAIVLVLLHRCSIYLRMNWAHPLIAGRPSILRIYYATDTRVDTIIVGCALALSMRDPRFAGFWRRFARWGPTPVAVPVAAVAVSAWALHSDCVTYTIGFTVIAICSALLIATVFSCPRSLLTKSLASPSMVFIGSISYGMYLFHPLTWSVIAGLSHGRTRQLGG